MGKKQNSLFARAIRCTQCDMSNAFKYLFEVHFCSLALILRKNIFVDVPSVTTDKFSLTSSQYKQYVTFSQGLDSVKKLK